MTRQDFEREAALRILPEMLRTKPLCDADQLALEVAEKVGKVADRLFTRQMLFDEDKRSAVGNGDRSGITVDELKSRGEISTRTRNLIILWGINYLAELSGSRWATLRSYHRVGKHALDEIDTALRKYGYEPLV